MNVVIQCWSCRKNYTKLSENVMQNEAKCFSCLVDYVNTLPENVKNKVFLPQNNLKELSYLISYLEYIYEASPEQETFTLTFSRKIIEDFNTLKSLLLCRDVSCEKTRTHFNFTLSNKLARILLNLQFTVSEMDLFYTRVYIENAYEIVNDKLACKKNNELSKQTLILVPESSPGVYSGLNALDFLEKLYLDSNYLRNEDFYNKFMNMKNRYNNADISETAKIIKVLPDAVLPSKSNLSDVGYDLTIIKVVKELTTTTTLYDTGLSIKPPYGYYAEVYGRSSISKSGFMVANNVGIIDPGYTGNLMIALTKTSPEANMTLPFKCCQIIFKKHNLIDIQQVSSFNTSTVRQDGGFGSTGI